MPISSSNTTELRNDNTLTATLSWLRLALAHQPLRGMRSFTRFDSFTPASRLELHLIFVAYGNMPTTSLAHPAFELRQFALAAILLTLTGHAWGQSTDGLSVAPQVVAAPVDDPQRDGWSTELWQAAASDQLKRIAALIASDEGIVPDALAPLLAADFACQPLRPDNLELVFSDGVVRVRRGPLQTNESPTLPAEHDLAAVLQSLRSPGDRERRVEIKVYRIEIADPNFTTRQFFTLFARTPSGSREIHAVWKATWGFRASNTVPELRSLQLEDYEETDVSSANGILMSDCTTAVFGSNPSLMDQLAFGLDYWSNRLL